MRIEVALYAGLTQYLPSGTRNHRAILEVRNGATVREVMDQLGMPPDIRGIPVLGGKQAAADAVLKEGETLAIFPPLAGGGARTDPSGPSHSAEEGGGTPERGMRFLPHTRIRRGPTGGSACAGYAGWNVARED